MPSVTFGPKKTNIGNKIIVNTSSQSFKVICKNDSKNNNDLQQKGMENDQRSANKCSQTHDKQSKRRKLNENFIDKEFRKRINDRMTKQTKDVQKRVDLPASSLQKRFFMGNRSQSKSAVGPPNLGRAQAPYSALSFCLLGKK